MSTNGVASPDGHRANGMGVLEAQLRASKEYQGLDGMSLMDYARVAGEYAFSQGQPKRDAGYGNPFLQIAWESGYDSASPKA